jgi:hypothetical protein
LFETGHAAAFNPHLCLKLGMLEQNPHLVETGHAAAFNHHLCLKLAMMQQNPHLSETGHAADENSPEPGHASAEPLPV